MAVTGTITQNVPSGTQQIIFDNPTEFENITYTVGTGFTYAVESSIVLNKSDFALFLQYKTQYYNTLFVNFPALNTFFTSQLPVCKFNTTSLTGPNVLSYNQTSTSSPVSLVYNISYDKVAETATFSARSNSITITPQEFLEGYFHIVHFINQCLLF